MGKILISFHLLGSLIVFLIGHYVFLRDSRGTINRVFFLMSIAGTLWGIGQTRLRYPFVSSPLSYIGWSGIAFLPTIFLHLSLLIAEKKEILKKRILLIFLHLPAFLVITLNIIGDFFISAERKRTSEKIFYILIAGYYLLYLSISIILLLKKYFSLKSSLERVKLRSFLTGALTPAVFGSILIFFIPGSPEIISALAFFSFVLGYLFVARGVILWRLFIDYRKILETVFKRLTELVIITDREGIILLTNEVTLSRFKYKIGEIIGKEIGKFIKGGKEKFKEISKELKEVGKVFEERIYFLTKEKQEIPFVLTFSLTKEGIIFIGTGVRELVSYQEKLEEEVKEKTQELEEAKTVLEIKVQSRTRELRRLAESLEQKVKERTKELQEKVEALEKSQKLTVDRELKIVELKKEIKRMKRKLSGRK